MKKKLLTGVAIVAVATFFGWAFAPPTEDEANRAAHVAGYLKGCEEVLAHNRATGFSVPEMERPGYCAREAEAHAREYGFR